MGMTAFILGRLLSAVPIFLAISLIIFVLMFVVPGDPITAMLDPRAASLNPEMLARMRAQWGLDDPIHIRYFRFLGNILQGDLGISYRTRLPVTEEILARFPATAQLAFYAMIWATGVGITLGVISAVKQYSILDTGSMVVALAGVSMPVFWLGLMLMYLVGVLWPILPPSGYGTWRHMVLPTITLGAAMTGLFARLTRSSMLSVTRLEYITTARAKGLSERMVIYKHALRNALMPVVTMAGLQLATLMGGAVITESVFAIPGVGRLTIDSISWRDMPTVQGCVLFLAVAFVMVNLTVDVLYAFIDPRVRYD